MVDTCRICRGDETDGELVRPCKCSGSIQFVHEDCLSDWLGHRYGQNGTGTERACELCSHVYQFEPVYSDDFDPKSANLKVYAYRLWRVSTRSRGRSHLVVRGLVAVFIASISACSTYSYVTKVSETWGAFVTHPFKDLFLKRALGPVLPESRPFTSWLDFGFKNPIVGIVWGSFVNGFALLIVTMFFGLTTWMVAIWTLHDPVLALECEEIMNNRSELNSEQELRQDLEYVKHLIRDNRVNAQARAHLLARLDNEFVEDPAWMPEQERETLEQRHQAEVQREELALEEDDGFWGLADDLLGGPLVTRIIGIIMAITFLNITLIGVFYGLPFTLGRSLVESIRATLEVLLSQSPNRVKIPQLPDSLEAKLFTYWIGVYFLLVAFKSPYTLLYRFLITSERGRASICTAKQIAAIEKVWAFVTIEAALFPLFCGGLLHIAFLPVMADTTLSGALTDIWNNPRMYLFAQWLIGFSYMYTLCDFFKGCRSFLRPGVLYFVQDPSDPRNEPIRNFLSHSVSSHLRKIGFSGLIYTGLILGGVGSVTSMFRLLGIVPVLIAPIDLKTSPGWSVLRYAVILLAFRPLVKLFKEAREAEQAEGTAVNVHSRFFKHEFERAARVLDLESFLFDREIKGQRGTGNYVRAPIKDNVVYPRGTVLFMPCTESGQLLKPAPPKVREMNRFKVVWRPQNFQVRVAALVLWIWAKAVAVSTAWVLMPLLVGRGFEYICVTSQPTLSDLVHYIVGLFFVCVFLFIDVTELVSRLDLRMFPRIVLSSIFRFNALEVVARLFAPQMNGLAQPSENKLVDYGLYAYLELVFGEQQDDENLFVGCSLAFLAAILPDYLALIISGGYLINQYVHKHQTQIENWKDSAVKDYYLVREELLNYSE